MTYSNKYPPILILEDHFQSDVFVFIFFSRQQIVTVTAEVFYFGFSGFFYLMCSSHRSSSQLVDNTSQQMSCCYCCVHGEVIPLLPFNFFTTHTFLTYLVRCGTQVLTYIIGTYLCRYHLLCCMMLMLRTVGTTTPQSYQNYARVFLRQLRVKKYTNPHMQVDFRN